MEQFNLDTWLKDKSRKVITRSGHNVRILCTDQRGNMPIVALVEFETLDGVQIFYSDGKNESHREYDLFFADGEEELTEFDYAVLSIISDHNSHTDPIEAFAKRSSKKLLDLARKEIEKDDSDWEDGYKQGKQDALKDLPKWKKATEHKDLEKHIAVLEDGKVLLSNYLEEGDYYIDLEDLKTLPKEE